MKRKWIANLLITSMIASQSITVKAIDSNEVDNSLNVEVDKLKEYKSSLLKEDKDILNISNCICGEYHPEDNYGTMRTTDTPVINGISINKQLIDINYSKDVTITPKYIVIHDTDNRRKGANAMANRNYFANHINAQASAHYLVDDSNIVQALEDNWRGWHVGDGNHQLINNSTTIGIELCVNSDNDFDKTLENGIELTKYLMNQYNIPAENVVRHYDASKKICPRMMMQDRPDLWPYFKEKISGLSGSGDGNISSDVEIPSTPDVSNSKKGIITANTSLNIRIGAGTNYLVIASLPKNKEVEILEELDSWYKVKFDGQVGYGSKQYIKVTDVDNNINTPSTPSNPTTPDIETKPEDKPTTDISSSKKGVITANTSLNIRSGAGTNYSVIASLSTNKEVEILEETGSWYKVKFDGKVGYGSKQYIKVTDGGNNTTTPSTPSKPTTPDLQTKPEDKPTTDTSSSKKGVITANTSLNIRSGAGTNYSVIASLPKNKEVEILEETDSWYKVKFDGKVGYGSKQYIKVTDGSNNTTTPSKPNNSTVETPSFTEKKAVVKVASGLNVRKGPGTKYDIMASLYNSKQVIVIGESGEWYKIRFDGREGYASKQYISIQ